VHGEPEPEMIMSNSGPRRKKDVEDELKEDMAIE
jgi:hypothetical protein